MSEINEEQCYLGVEKSKETLPKSLLLLYSTPEKYCLVLSCDLCEPTSSLIFNYSLKLIKLLYTNSLSAILFLVRKIGNDTCVRHILCRIHLHHFLMYIVTRLVVTIGRVWIDSLIHWTHTTRDYTLQITVTHRLVFSVTVFTALLGKGFQQWTFLCSRAHVLAGWRPSHTNLLLF
jgi:hypothetical protein